MKSNTALSWIFFSLLVTTSSRSAATDSPNCSNVYEKGYTQGEKVGGAYGEMLGVVEGTIYGLSVKLRTEKHCLTGNPKEQVKAIATVFKSDEFAKNSMQLSDVPTEAETLMFLNRYFTCGK
ncbi:MAG TPA: hypothetical protein VFV64_04120 [Permianibacter sp.]|nr:hypothetical protein [Permianibacter sp.]